MTSRARKRTTKRTASTATMATTATTTVAATTVAATTRNTCCPGKTERSFLVFRNTSGRRFLTRKIPFRFDEMD